VSELKIPTKKIKTKLLAEQITYLYFSTDRYFIRMATKLKKLDNLEYSKNSFSKTRKNFQKLGELSVQP